MASTSASRALVRQAGLRRDRGGEALGREPRAVQRLADVDVAEPRHDLLVRQRGLERRLLALARARQHGGIEFVAERLGAERAQQRLAVEFGARNELHHAEAAGVVEGDARARRHVEHHVVVRRAASSAHGNSRPASFRHAALRDAERARHAEMHHQHVAGRQVGEQIFGAPAEPLDRLALRAGRRNPSAAASAGRRGAPRPW